MSSSWTQWETCWIWSQLWSRPPTIHAETTGSQGWDTALRSSRSAVMMRTGRVVNQPNQQIPRFNCSLVWKFSQYPFTQASSSTHTFHFLSYSSSSTEIRNVHTPVNLLQPGKVFLDHKMQQSQLLNLHTAALWPAQHGSLLYLFLFCVLL